MYVHMFDIVVTMKEYWSSANFSRNHPRQKKVLCMWSKMHILSFYFVGQMWQTCPFEDLFVYGSYQGKQLSHSENLPFFQKIFRFVKYCAHIWNHHGQCNKMSTNKPMFGTVIFEIAYGAYAIFHDKISSFHWNMQLEHYCCTK